MERRQEMARPVLSAVMSVSEGSEAALERTDAVCAVRVRWWLPSVRDQRQMVWSREVVMRCVAVRVRV